MADKPHDTVSKIVFAKLDSTSTKELEGGFLQAVDSDTNLLRPPIYDHVLDIHALYMIEIRVSPWEYHSITL